MDTALDVAAGALAVLGLALLLHVTLPPALRRRAIVWRGAETMVATLALLAAVATQWWPAVGIVLAAFAVAQVWAPWLVWGVPAAECLVLARRSASMVRARCEPVPGHPRRLRIGDAATLRALALGPRVTLLVLTGTRTPKVRLWRNVLRKQAANQSVRVA